jgi:hypothetical protein
VAGRDAGYTRLRVVLVLIGTPDDT